MIIIGVTGSIGSGKSTVINMLKDMGIPVHYADRVVADLLCAKGIAVRQLGKMFPEAMEVDDEGYAYINRDELGKIVFRDREKKQQLEKFLHPLVKANSDEFTEAMKLCGHKMVALEIPLLFETGRDKEVDFTVCVVCSHDHRKERTLVRSGMTSEKFDAIVSGQMKDKEKQELANYVILNDGELDETRAHLEKVIFDIQTKVSKMTGLKS